MWLGAPPEGEGQRAGVVVVVFVVSSSESGQRSARVD
jgi:hypothetical protein